MTPPIGITPLPEKRALPYRAGLDRDMGAYVNDAHSRLVAAFGYHPDGTPASDEAAYIVTACNQYPKLVEALANTLALARIKWGNMDVDADKVLTDTEAVLAACGEVSK